MIENSLFPVDLKQKRRQANLTQEQMADRLGIVRESYVRIENGTYKISLSHALECAKLFGSLTIRKDGATYVLKPDGSMDPDGGPDGGASQAVPNTEDYEDYNGVAHAVHTKNQLAEGIKAVDDALSDMRLWHERGEATWAHRVRLVKELYDVQAATGGMMAEIELEEPDVIDEGRRLHLLGRGLLDAEETEAA